jgi:hypothetical protein
MNKNILLQAKSNSFKINQICFQDGESIGMEEEEEDVDDSSSKDFSSNQFSSKNDIFVDGESPEDDTSVLNVAFEACST